MLVVTRCGTSSRASRFSYPASVGIQLEDALGEVRPGVGADDRVAVAEPLLESQLSRVVLAGAVAAVGRHAGELRERTQQVRARDIRSVGAGRQQAGERVGHLHREKVDRRLVARRAGREILSRDVVQLEVCREVVSVAADVPGLEQPLTRQFSLHRSW